MPQGAVNWSVRQAVRAIKAMEHQGFEWSQDYRAAGREALQKVLEGRMARCVEGYLERLAARDGSEPDRRNGHYVRHLLTELGDIELSVPRTRRYSAMEVVRAYARRTAHVDRVILACFVLGLSTRKVGKALVPILGESVSPTTVSRVAQTLDAAVSAFHRRRLKDAYRALLFDGVVLARRTGAGAVRRPVLVAMGIRPDGKKEIIDYRLSASESEAEWEAFLSDLYGRGLEGKGVALIGVDGGKGLLAALSTVVPGIPVQRCWAHKARNVLDKVRKADHEAARRDLAAIREAQDVRAARSAARRFADRWEPVYPKAVACLRQDLDDLLTFFLFQDPVWRKAVRTTNAIERKFVEVRRRTRPMGVFSDRTSMDRILFAVFTYENSKEGIYTPFLLTQNS